MNKHVYIYIYGITDDIAISMCLCVLLAVNSLVCNWVNLEYLATSLMGPTSYVAYTLASLHH